MGQASFDLQLAQTSQDPAAIQTSIQAFASSAQQLASSVPADAPTEVKAGLTKIASTIKKALQSDKADPQTSQTLSKTLAKVQPYLTQTCPTS